MIIQVHIHPIITPTSTTNNSPVADPSIASLVVLTGVVVVLTGVVVVSLGAVDASSRGIVVSVEDNFVVGIVVAPEDSVVFVSHSVLTVFVGVIVVSEDLSVVASSQLLVGHEHSRRAFPALNVMLHLQVELELIGVVPFRISQFIAASFVISTN